MIYVMSDIHGNKERFHSVMKQINLQPNDTLYVLGDVIDRHEDGIEILEEIMCTPNIKMLLGNHEYMMLNVFSSKHYNYWSWYRELWYRNSGEVTDKKFLMLNKEKRKEIISFLEKLPINIDIVVNDKRYKLVHACPLEMYNELPHSYKDIVEFAVWYRIQKDLRLDSTIVVFGHTTTNHYNTINPIEVKPMTIYKSDNLIGIDCGSGYPEVFKEGRLACLRLDDMKEFYSERVNTREID